ncbi:MAG: 2-C-methyl-D-erythritol 2,4-cyclodiphosphate synthase [Bacteroidetes bacterium]|jgi:2-C-methyl-D-erythritol 2,4-cyclodiphosphate synthase|nr:2-C-methyl-D-erythritol 2,4-cyclodiphosphate synthase [Bacteroidota bacterium]MBT3748964.1 2-C-methyl-D-erythritol 2,4-cyclodiphosphate synthase [Bacteroidota bacterium]MBT4398360.1 2-C-methyl-D-erythritol 2,4-cyclodiphosphate synthase [Bacteroidota bacterium]MBT5425179.1 2-C-methyl-D-erythritol 2,4-cyclodiphosphate synthase [Bacteroidota bacterium]MBT7093363.1 2-C-methyl-D-erythritol 2,4-cyclodiphosphate synthase [Bacteroidota bacterium]
MNIRIGFGYDVHQLVPNRKLVIGGIEIEHNKGTLGHSDGDALIHAICDALLGALALRDIGYHFPDTSSEYKDIDSKILLKRTCKLINDKGWEPGNIDVTVCLEKPKLNSHISKMQKTLASILAIMPDQLSIKATTNEKMGFVGQENGIAVYAVCTVLRSP